MRILFVADAASIHTRRWLEYFRDQGHEVHVASFRPYDIAGVSVHLMPRFGLGKLGYFFALWFLPRLYARVQPDIVHAHYLTSYGFLAARAGLHPLVVTAWGSDALLAPQESRLLRYFASYAVRHADAATTLAAHMNAAVAQLGVPLERITATPFGVDTEFFRPSAAEASGANAPLRLISTRNFDTVYDIQTLIRALGQVFASGRRLEVDLIGDGPLRQSLVELVRELGLEPHVKFHGHVEHKVLVGLLAGADLFVSSAVSDGNNVSLNEAMACGCFPIATQIPANAQWIQDGRNGYLYPAGDAGRLAAAIERAADNGTLRRTARAENRRIVETQADWKICVKRMETIYQELITRRGAS